LFSISASLENWTNHCYFPFKILLQYSQ